MTKLIKKIGRSNWAHQRSAAKKWTCAWRGPSFELFWHETSECFFDTLLRLFRTSHSSRRQLDHQCSDTELIINCVGGVVVDTSLRSLCELRRTQQRCEWCMRKENSSCSLLTRINSQTTNHDRLWKQPMRFQARTTQRPVNFPNTTKKVSKPQTSAWKRSRQDARQCPEKEHATLINCWPACTRPPIMPPQISPSKTYAEIYTIASRKTLSKPTWSVTPAVLSSWEISRQRQTSSKIHVFATTQRKQKQLQLWSATTNKQCAMRRVARRNTCRAKHMASTTEPINKKSLPPPHAGLEKLHITLRSFCACFNMTDQLLEETRTLKQSVASSAPQPGAMCYMALHATNKREHEHKKVKSRKTTHWWWAPDLELQWERLKLDPPRIETVGLQTPMHQWWCNVPLLKMCHTSDM